MKQNITPELVCSILSETLIISLIICCIVLLVIVLSKLRK